MNALRRARLCALVLIIALVAGVSVSGRHAVALAMSSASAATVLAGEDVVICSNGILKTVRLDADGRPVDPDNGPVRFGPCTVCTGFTAAAAPLLAHPAVEAPQAFGPAMQVRHAACFAHRIATETAPIRAPPAFS